MGRLSRYGWRPVDPPRRPVLFVNQRSGGGRAARAAWPSEHASEGSTLSSSMPPRAWGSWFVKPSLSAQTRSASPVATAPWRWSPRLHGRMAFRSCAFPPAPATILRSTSACDRHDLIGALDAFTDGVERSIDVAEVNGRVFLNNVSLGIYGDAVRQPAYRNAKMRTLVETAAEVLGPSAALPELHLVDDLGREHSRPAVVLVSNNPYALDRPIAPGTRPRLDTGELGVVVLDTSHPDLDPPGRAWRATQLAVDASAPVHAGIDGEAVELHAPLAFVIRPGVLRVRISSRHPGVSPSGLLP